MYGTIALSLMRMLSIVLTGWGVAGTASAQEDDGSTRFRDLPKGWTVTKSVPAFSFEIAGQTVRVTHTFLAADKQPLRVNTVACKTDEGAARVHEMMVRGKGGVQARCPREGKLVFEFIGETRMVERAYLELGFKPQRVTYDVSFQATPIAKCDYMEWNKMYIAFLPKEPSEIEVRNLAKSFTFGGPIRLRNHGLGSETSSFSFASKAVNSKLEADGEVTAYSFANLPSKYGVPQVGFTAVITSEAFAITPSKRKAGKELLEATEFWPSADAEIVALARNITAQSADPGGKLEALLAWFANADNFQYDKKVPGTRYGVRTALKQRFGRCWDYSDCFVTLCRAVGIPSRQVLGWLHGMDGHIWAEVLINGKGWRQVDPMAGAGCDSRYVPFIATETGAMPVVYTSAVRVVPQEAKDRKR